MALLTVREVSAGYGRKQIIAGFNFEIEQEQFVSILGPNGSGKSTLLKCLSGILRPKQGSVWLHDKPLASYGRREIAKRIAVVGDEPTSFEFTARQMVTMGRFAHMGRFASPTSDDETVVEQAMRDVSIWHKRDSLYGELSQGEQQKVRIARAIAQQPEVLLLDEPTSHLDIANQYGVLQLIKSLATQRGMAVLFVIHDINLALDFSTDMILVQQGSMLAWGKPKQVLTQQNLRAMYGISFKMVTDIADAAATTFIKPDCFDDVAEVNQLVEG